MSRPRRQAATAAVLLLFFAIDAALVASNLLDPFDRWVLHHLRRLDLPGVALTPEWTVTLALWVTSLGAGPARLVVTLAGSLWLAARRRARDAMLYAAAVASGAAALPALKLLFHRARPELPWRLAVEHDLSFPSGHAMGAALTYALGGWLLAGRGGAIAGIALAVAIGLTRIFLGVHWASDVAGGWLVGGAWVFAALALRARSAVSS